MSLNGEYDRDNIFAKILRGEMPCVKVFEDAHTLAFMDVFPQSRGHVLLIPKAASRNLFDTEPDILTKLIAQTQRIGAAVKSALNPDGIIITQFNGAPAGQTVFHLHFHIIPRYSAQEMNPHADGNMADMDELRALAAQIKQQLN